MIRLAVATVTIVLLASVVAAGQATARGLNPDPAGWTVSDPQPYKSV